MTNENLPPDSHLPQLLEAEFSRDQVLALFRDLQSAAAIERVQIRYRDEDGRILDQAASLEFAQATFAAGRAVAIQIAYLFDGLDWSDTLQIGPDTTKIIRLQRS